MDSLRHASASIAKRIVSDLTEYRLRDILVPQRKSGLNAGSSRSEGRYPFFNCSERQTKFSDVANAYGENLFVTTGGDFLFTHFSAGDAAYSTDVWCLKAVDGVDCSYINHVLQDSIFDLQKYFQGFKFKHLDKHSFLDHVVALPPFEEQRKISRILDIFKTGLGDIETLVRMREALFTIVRQQLLGGDVYLDNSDEKLFVAINSPEHRWSVSTISEHFKVVGGGTPSKDIDEYWGGNIPWITPKDIGDGFEKLTTGSTYLAQPGAARMRSKMLPAGSLVVTTRASIGRCGVAANDLFTNQGCHGLVPIGELNVEFVKHWIGANVDRLKDLANGTTFLELSRNALKNLEVPQPTRLEQDLIARTLNDMLATTASLRALSEVGKAKFNWLRRQLLSGKFEVQEIRA